MKSIILALCALIYVIAIVPDISAAAAQKAKPAIKKPLPGTGTGVGLGGA